METIEKSINGYNVEAIESTVAAITGNPKIAAFQFRATNEWISGGHNRSRIKSLYGACQEDSSRNSPFVLETDMPPVLLGKNNAANPAEIMLHALLGCMTTTMMLQGSARGIKVSRVTSKVTGNIDLQGALGLDENIPKEFSSVNISFDIEGDLSNEEKKELIMLAKRSPVYNALINPVSAQVKLSA
jgi:uncharacterized OsmC-like protein